MAWDGLPSQLQPTLLRADGGRKRSAWVHLKPPYTTLPMGAKAQMASPCSPMVQRCLLDLLGQAAISFSYPPELNTLLLTACIPVQASQETPNLNRQQAETELRASKSFPLSLSPPTHHKGSLWKARLEDEASSSS